MHTLLTWNASLNSFIPLQHRANLGANSVDCLGVQCIMDEQPQNESFRSPTHLRNYTRAIICGINFKTNITPLDKLAYTIHRHLVS